jgi:hypothetical protein
MKSHGYMIREMHAVVNFTQDQWVLTNDQDHGGYWGAIPNSLYDAHLTWLENLIKTDSLAMMTATEAVKYRITANNCSAASMTKNNDTNYTLQVTAAPLADTRYQDEISVICKFPNKVSALDVVYPTSDPSWGNHPYHLPRALTIDSTTWSINVNPFLSNGSTHIILNRPWSGNIVSNSVINPETKFSSMLRSVIKVIGLNHGIVRAIVPAGVYRLSILNLNGKEICKPVSGFSSSAGEVSAHFNPDGLAKGFYIINIKSSENEVTAKALITR